MQRKDQKGRKLRVGEYYDSENKRYMFRKMINGKRYTITDSDLIELRKQEAELINSIENGGLKNKELEKMTLDQYFEVWCTNSGKTARKATSLMNYKAYYRAHVKGTELGTMEIGKIRKIHCQELFNKMIDAGSKKSTLNNMKGCLTMIFCDAEDDNAIVKNPCRNIRFNHADTGTREAIEMEQVELFMNFIKNDEIFSVHYNMFVVLFNLGVRVGEICGLTWNCIDMEHSTLTIDKSLNRYRKNEYGFTNALGSTKSKNSKRTITFNKVVAQALDRQRKYQEESEMNVQSIPIVDNYGRKIGETSGFVFTQVNGNVWNEPSIVKLLHRIVKKQNEDVTGTDKPKLRYFTPHQIRHTYTTLAYEAGADEKGIAMRLGHSSEKITKDTYTHLRGEKKKEQEATINKICIN
ncbi:MAG: tyrosine-type recombinase/integrase [Lachnospiraceae bacterium]|nr:tyrosine-type recombinase/integrase [Lachnospiraceae bacterium]